MKMYISYKQASVPDDFLIGLETRQLHYDDTRGPYAREKPTSNGAGGQMFS